MDAGTYSTLMRFVFRCEKRADLSDDVTFPFSSFLCEGEKSPFSRRLENCGIFPHELRYDGRLLVIPAAVYI